ncbi:MAG: glutamine synthetase family protein [Clostridia bacterium]|nr:glutamine synthetase family protein [Clostridia bacterium]
MNYTKEEVLQYVAEEDVKFIRLSFCDVFGRQKNISIMPDELYRAFETGIAFDASAITGFGDETQSGLLLHPDPDTLSVLPWRPEHGRVVRMYSYITYPDGTPFEADTRALLKKAISEAEAKGYSFFFGSEQEFYLFETDDFGAPTTRTYDKAGYMDIAPDDRGENVRREVCLTLEQMGICPESSHHEEGPGQNEIDFRYSDPLTAADNTMTFQTVVRTVAKRNGVYADFSPKPIEGQPGNGFHINMSVKPDTGDCNLGYMIAGVLERAKALTVFLNPSDNSYRRLGRSKAPKYISWSKGNRSQLIRIPEVADGKTRAELRSPDPSANPYLAFALIIYAGLAGLENQIPLQDPAEINLFKADGETLSRFEKLPETRAEAIKAALESDFIRERVPAKILEIYCGR